MNPKRAKNISIRLRSLAIDGLTKKDLLRAFMGSPVDRSRQEIMDSMLDVLESNDRQTNGILVLHTMRQEQENLLAIQDEQDFIDTFARVICRSFTDVSPIEFRDVIVSMLEGVRYTEGTPD